MQLSNFDRIDFSRLYQEQTNLTSFKPKSQEDWDNKAQTMNKKIHNSIYDKQFIEKLHLDGVKSLLDVGCGVGNLSLKLASNLNEVYAMDYSKVMLEKLEENKNKKNLNNISIIEKSWTDSWNDVPNADLVIASRSLVTQDAKESLLKLNQKANKKIALSYKVGSSFLSEEILDVMKRDIIKRPDYIYIVNILYQLGINAKVDFIQSENANIDSFEQLLNLLKWSIGDLKPQEVQLLAKFYLNTMSKKENKQEYIKWALISWDKKA